MGFFMSKNKGTYHFSGTLELESGRSIRDFDLAYTTWGYLNEAKDNVVWIFHAMTANSDPAEWWPGMVGDGKFFDPTRYFIICVNMPGGCYGSVGPLHINPESGALYLKDFPFFTPRDMAKAYDALRIHLGVEKIYLGIGGSMGGQQLLAWATNQPALFKFIVPIAANAVHSPWGKAFNASQRFCIEKDPSWALNEAEAGMEGMKIARSIALISYRNYETYQKTQEDSNHAIENTRSESYQRYQGEKLAKRFNAISYHMLTRSMDSHDLGRGSESVEKTLGTIQSACLVIGITSDILYPISEQKFIKDHIPGAELAVIESLYGHDGFLLEDEKITTLLKKLTTQ